jgi:hypothetical protein
MLRKLKVHVGCLLVGVFAQESPLDDHHGDSYIMANYIKFIEQSGALVVPIRFGTFDSEDIDSIELIYFLSLVAESGRKPSIMRKSSHKLMGW